MDVALPAARRAWTVPAATAWACCALVVLLAGYALIGGPLDGQGADPYVWAAASTGLFGGALAAVLLTRSPRHPIGWLFLVTGLTRAAAGAAQVWCVSALVTHPGRPLGGFAAWLQVWTPAAGLVVAPVIIVLFPDGRLPGRRWRVVPALSAIAFVLVAVVLPAGAWRYRGPRLLPTAPVPDDSFARTVDRLYELGIVLTVVSAVIALVGILLRFRRASGDVRQQIKWFGYGAVCAFVANLTAAATGVGWLIQVGIVAVFVGVGAGIFRYRLYDVDRLIRRTLLYGLLTVTLVAAFAALDITIAVITGRDSTVAAAVAAFVVALLLRPARDRVQDLVDRLYDRRAYSGVRLMRRLGEGVGRDAVAYPVRVRDGLRTALHDPALQVYYPLPGGRLVDGHGNPADPTAA
ncbi:MAG TPA: hypothetical protein VHA75_05800, partial [Rugosimonospora sp.]|nr:hypothetical protein [Rugosimonospora sp.]